MTVPAPQPPRAELDAEDWAHTTPALRALGFEFRVRTDDATLGEYLDRLFAPFAVDAASSTHCFSMRRYGTDDQSRWLLHLDDQHLLTTPGASVAFSVLLWEINQHVISNTAGRLLLHAAAAERDGVTVLLPGPMDAGKSTLVAGLLRAGFRYLTDEIVCIDAASGMVQPYPRPISLGRGSHVALADIEPVRPAELAEYLGDDEWRIIPGDVHPDAIGAPGRPRQIVAPRYQHDGAAKLEPMTRAEAVVLLAGQCFGFASSAHEHLAQIAAVVSGCDCYRLAFDDLDEACAEVLNLVAAAADGTPPAPRGTSASR